MKKHKKIFYVSGLISLLFISPLFWYFSKPTLEKMNLRVMDIGLPYKAKNGEKAPEYSQIPMEGWNYKAINIPINFNNETEMKFIGVINKLQNDKIEKSGIKFQFSNQNSYKDLVNLLNIFLKTKQEHYGIDMEKTQYSKLIEEIPEVDIVVTMGCNVNCPYLPSKHREDWGLDDSSGKTEKEFKEVISTIHNKVLDLRKRIIEKEIEI